MADDAAVGGHRAAQDRKQLGDGGLAVAERRGDGSTAEARAVPPRHVLLDELPHLIDGLDAVQITLALRRTPREEAVAAQDDAVAARMFLDRLAQHQRQLESRPLPRDPDHAPAVLAIEFLQLLLAIRARRQRDRPVGVQMIDVRERQERVQRRVNRSGHPVLAERAERVEADHLVLVRLAAVARDQRLELVEVQHGKPGGRDRAQVAAAALHRHHPLRLAGQRIGQLELRARIAAAEVRDAQVLAEQIRSIAQQLQRRALEPRRLAVVPQVLQKRRLFRGCVRHRSTPRIPGSAGSARPSDRPPPARSARRETIAR
jgi:hypothetical protein